jgi:hypothetical protein
MRKGVPSEWQNINYTRENVPLQSHFCRGEQLVVGIIIIVATQGRGTVVHHLLRNRHCRQLEYTTQYTLITKIPPKFALG